MRQVLLSLLLLASALPALAQSPDAGIRPFGLPVIETLGRAMFEQDVQAASATDLVLAVPGFAQRQDIRGWIVVGAGDSATVRFIRDRDGVFEAAYDIAFAQGAQPSVAEPRDARLPADQLAHFRARTLALASIERPCSDRFNAIVLPDPEAPEQWLVWTIAATVKPGVMPVGGHTRFTISADGGTILRRDALSRSCLVMEKAKLPPGAAPVAVAVSHIVSPTPVETHVFLGLLHRMPLFVATADKTYWTVDAGRIGTVDPSKLKGAPR